MQDSRIAKRTAAAGHPGPRLLKLFYSCLEFQLVLRFRANSTRDGTAEVIVFEPGCQILEDLCALFIFQDSILISYKLGEDRIARRQGSYRIAKNASSQNRVTGHRLVHIGPVVVNWTAAGDHDLIPELVQVWKDPGESVRDNMFFIHPGTQDPPWR